MLQQVLDLMERKFTVILTVKNAVSRKQFRYVYEAACSAEQRNPEFALH